MWVCRIVLKYSQRCLEPTGSVSWTVTMERRCCSLLATRGTAFSWTHFMSEGIPWKDVPLHMHIVHLLFPRQHIHHCFLPYTTAFIHLASYFMTQKNELKKRIHFYFGGGMGTNKIQAQADTSHFLPHSPWGWTVQIHQFNYLTFLCFCWNLNNLKRLWQMSCTYFNHRNNIH